MGTKTRIAVLAGGISGEHQVSLMSARNVVVGLEREKYEVIIIGIDRQGRWRLFEDADWLNDPDDPAGVRLAGGGRDVALLPGHNRLYLPGQGWGPEVDVVFPVLHGPGGEDGTVQALCELSGIPCVGAGVLGSAAGMNKVVTKRLCMQEGLNTGSFIEITRTMRGSSDASWKSVSGRLEPPLFVKPVSLGSSVGISMARNSEEYASAIDEGFRHDISVIVEEYVDGREIECAVIGNEDPEAAPPGEIIPKGHDYYSYESKYLDPDGAELRVPADIPEETAGRVMELSCRAFRAVRCRGMARVDFFLRNSDSELLINEINTIPGFTAISMFPRMWANAGMSLPQLLDRLVSLAME